jgi:hypothetical protein
MSRILYIIIINYAEDVIEKTFGNKKGYKILFNDVLRVKPKFVVLIQ